MNKIIVDKNTLVEYKDSNISIKGNKIIFSNNGDYTLEYVDSDFIELEIVLLDNALINLFVISCNNSLKIKNHYQLGNNSSLDLFKFYYNEMVNEELLFDLNGNNSKLSYSFSSISKGNEEYHIIVNHNHHRVSSKISNKCIGVDGSKIRMQIDSVLAKGNVDCVMDQDSRILTLGDVNAAIVPNMFIEEDSVVARHGSVVGRIRPEEIFYLMSRGIAEDEAVNLLMKGFIFSNLIVDMEKRARIFQIIQELRR